jgi:hypothetical protein
MTANHVQSDQNLQNAAMFGEGQDGFNYSNLYTQGPTFSNTLLPDQQNPHLNGTPSHSPYNSASAFSPPAWQNAATTSTSIPSPQNNQYLTANRGYYGLPPSSNTTPFIGGHGVQYNQHVDPSLFRHGENRAFSHSTGMPSTTSQSATTIAPASLHQAATVNHQVASPGASMQSVFSAQSMGNRQQEMARVPAVNAASVVQVRKAPKGTQSGNFVIVSFEDMAKATQSKKLASYVNIGLNAVDLNLTKGMYGVITSMVTN